MDRKPPGPPIRVLNVCETARGGVGIYQNLLQPLQDMGFDLHVIAPLQHAQILETTLQVTTFDNPKRGLASIWRMLRCFARTRRSLKPNICFFHSTLSLAALAFMRATGDRRPAIYCAHGWAVSNYDPDSLKGRIVRRVEGRLCGLADVVINVSSHEMQLAADLGYRGRHLVVENAVLPPSPKARDDLFAAEPAALHLLFVGRFDRQKGLDLLLEAFAEARRVNPALRLHVIGAAVRDNDNTLDLPDGVSMVGWVDAAKIDDWYCSADALLVPSRWEAFGLVIPEALRNGTPVICARRGGMPDLIVAGKTGDDFDLDPTAMTQMLVRLDKARLRIMRPACRQAYDERFVLQRLLDQLAQLLIELKEQT